MKHYLKLFNLLIIKEISFLVKFGSIGMLIPFFDNISALGNFSPLK